MDTVRLVTTRRVIVPQHAEEIDGRVILRDKVIEAGKMHQFDPQNPSVRIWAKAKILKASDKEAKDWIASLKD